MTQTALSYSDLLERAIAIAGEAHRGQSSKTGGPFIDHVRRVADSVSGNDERLVAWLHDVVEKGPGWSLDRVMAEGFPQRVVSAVDAMTKRDDEDYFAFVQRSASDPLARPVKRADLSDNLMQVRQVGGDPSKYVSALRLVGD